MNGGSRQTRRFGAFLVAVSLLHAAALLIPAAHRAIAPPFDAPAVSVRLKPAQPPRPTPEPAAQRTPEPPPEAAPKPQPVPEPVDRPAPEKIARTPPPPADEPRPPVITAHRIISDLAAARERDPLAFIESGAERRGGFREPIGPSLDEVLNAPSLQLPFRDRRIYLVDSYAPGIGGSIDRFFDSVTVPFGFQTRNNTRIQCAWILVLAGCSWGDASLFYAADRARKRKPDPE